MAVAVGGLLVAACSSPRPSARSTSTTSTTTAAAGTSSTSTTGAGGPPRCAASDLAASLAGTQGAAGTFEVTIELRNVSTATCTLQGYPGAQLYGSGGAALPTNVVRGGSYSFTDFSPALVTLAPSAPSWFNMAYSDVPTGTTACPAATSMWITPPDATDHLVLTQQFVACDGGKLTVSPVFGQGSPDTKTTAPAHP